MSIDQKLETMPRINWPEKTGFYKIVQLDIAGQPYIRFEEESEISVDHADIIKSLAEILGKDYPKIKNGDVHCIPALKSDWYEVRGMGRAAVDTERRAASFFGNSADYELEIDADHLESIKPLVPDWRIKKD